MTSSQKPAALEPDRFGCGQLTADGTTAAWVREEFGRWLRRRTDLDETRLCDVLLAVNEAVANTAEFAYLQDRQPGTFDVEAALSGGILTVTVTDRGRWRPSDPQLRQRCRGRGIPLMRTLADDLHIAATGAGTTVCLRFDRVAAAHPAEVMV